jgi:hypothetical protein
VIPTVEKLLACKDFGKGAMAQPENIVKVVNFAARQRMLWSGAQL